MRKRRKTCASQPSEQNNDAGVALARGLFHGSAKFVRYFLHGTCDQNVVGAERCFSSSVFLSRYQEENRHEKDYAWPCCSCGHLYRRAGNGADWLLRRPRRDRRRRRRTGPVLSLRLRLSVRSWLLRLL